MLTRKQECKLFMRACPKEVFDRLKYDGYSDSFVPKKKYENSMCELNAAQEINFAWKMWKIRGLIQT